MKFRKNYTHYLFVTFLTATFSGVVFAAAEENESENEVVETEVSTFEKLGFGLGLSLTIDTGNVDRIDSASLVNNIVRADTESQTIARIMLETHYFFEPRWRFLGMVEPGKWGVGPFVGIVSGENEIITATALGVMLGFKKDASDPASGSWNLGLGWVVDPKVKTLGDGIRKNMALPDGETSIRYKEHTQKGIAIIFSTSF